jgi:hypothetical protein
MFSAKQATFSQGLEKTAEKSIVPPQSIFPLQTSRME